MCGRLLPYYTPLAVTQTMTTQKPTIRIRRDALRYVQQSAKKHKGIGKGQFFTYGWDATRERASEIPVCFYGHCAAGILNNEYQIPNLTIPEDRRTVPDVAAHLLAKTNDLLHPNDGFTPWWVSDAAVTHAAAKKGQSGPVLFVPFVAWWVALNELYAVELIGS